MSQRDEFIEPLGEFAQEAYKISGSLCGSCSDLHALWPYIRLSRASTGVEEPGSMLELSLRGLISEGRRDVLIAGSADTGLLALTARAAADYAVNIAVLDICETPLEMCRQFAARCALPIETVRQDLRKLKADRKFDLVLVHGTLHFIEPGARREALVRIRSVLRSKGRLVLLFNTSRARSVELAEQTHADYAADVLRDLERQQIPLPDIETRMAERLAAHSRQRQLREGAFAEPEDVEQLLDASGLRLIDCSELTMELGKPMSNFVSRIAKRRFLAIAAPSDAPPGRQKQRR